MLTQQFWMIAGAETSATKFGAVARRRAAAIRPSELAIPCGARLMAGAGQAIRLYSRSNAFLFFRDPEIGSMELGKHPHFIVPVAAYRGGRRGVALPAGN